MSDDEAPQARRDLTEDDRSAIVTEIMDFTRRRVEAAGGRVVDGAVVLIEAACWAHATIGVTDGVTACGGVSEMIAGIADIYETIYSRTEEGFKNHLMAQRAEGTTN